MAGAAVSTAVQCACHIRLAKERLPANEVQQFLRGLHVMSHMQLGKSCLAVLVGPEAPFVTSAGHMLLFIWAHKGVM